MKVTHKMTKTKIQLNLVYALNGKHLEAWQIYSAHAPLNRDDGGLLPDAYLHLVRKKAAN